ncbi:MAG: aldehyde dehydrogenase family protein, partial [Myxococcota bacterium]
AKYFNQKAEKILRPRKIAMSLFKNRASYIHYQPRGLVLVIAPWNFPLSIPMGTVIMALLAGNAVILKPASLTPIISCRMRDLMIEAGLDPDLFQVITGPGKLGSELISAGVVDYVNFTGSTGVGLKVAELAASKMIPSSMELGGKAPAIVFEDADIENAARSVVWGSFGNSGQICASVERVYVHEKAYDRFVSLVVEHTGRLRQGNPLTDANLDVGAMTDPSQITIIERQIREALAGGAKVLTGGRRSAAGTQFFEPTVIVDVTDAMAVAREESFGPVMPIMKFSTDEEVIRRANDSPYGLLAYVFSRNRKRALRVAEQIEAGTVMINETLMTHAFPETPWTGVKQSGIGRVHSDDGLLDLCQARHVNYDVIPMANPVWYPYSNGVLSRFISLASLLTKSQDIPGKRSDIMTIIKGA